MNKHLLKYIAIVVLIVGLISCEDEGEKVIMLDNPIPPTFESFPDLNFSANRATDTIVFIGTPVDLGFQAPFKYYIEAGAVGDNFAKPIILIVSSQDTLMKATVADINKLMVKKFKAGTSTIDFRIRAVAIVDAGTGALGTSSNPLAFVSETKTTTATLY